MREPKCLPLSHFSKCSIRPIVSKIGPEIELLHKNLETFNWSFLSCPLIMLDQFYKTIYFIIKLKLFVLIWEVLSPASAIKLPIV
jgi:hypothetical protein